MMDGACPGPHLASMGSFSCLIASFPGPCRSWLHKEQIFSHVHDIKGGKAVERTVGALRLRTTRIAKVSGDISSWWGATILHTKRWTCNSLNNQWNFAFRSEFCGHLLIMSSSHEKRYKAFPTFPNASDKKLGRAWERGYLCTPYLAHVSAIMVKIMPA